MEKLKYKDDWVWYTKRLDAEGRYEYRHNGEPEKYPCIVSSQFWDDPNGPYTYDHDFYYEVEHICSECGHKTKDFPVKIHE